MGGTNGDRALDLLYKGVKTAKITLVNSPPLIDAMAQAAIGVLMGSFTDKAPHTTPHQLNKKPRDLLHRRCLIFREKAQINKGRECLGVP